VATDPGWREMLRGLGGVTVSVPLAEEALHNILAETRKLPAELTASIQLNPWFSARFATRFRRRTRGKRIRVRERAATSRGWSHARTLVSDQLPAPWSSRHGRGVGRPLDRWSRRLLNDYAELMLMTFGADGVPAVLAPLFAVAAAATPDLPVPESAAATWTSLPRDEELVARRLVRLDARIVEPSELRNVETVRDAVAALSNDAAEDVAALQALLA